MTGRARALWSFCLASLLSALALGSRILLMTALFCALIGLYAFLSCLLFRSTFRFSQSVSTDRVLRGEKVLLHVTMRHKCVLPVGRAEITCRTGDRTECFVRDIRAYTDVCCELENVLRHVGEDEAGVCCICLRDVFGLFCLHKRVPEGFRLLCLPRPFDIDIPDISAGDDSQGPFGSRTEDYTSPSDNRAWMPGDALKRVHWKLSARRRELTVRRCEMPSPPDTLILVDMSGTASYPEREEGLCVTDTLFETAVSVASRLMRDMKPVRIPLYTEQATEFLSDRADCLPVLQETLARKHFGGPYSYPEVLRMALRQTRATGLIVLITGTLTMEVTEAAVNLKKTGHAAVLYLCVPEEKRDIYLPYVSCLNEHLVEVCYVTPA